MNPQKCTLSKGINFSPRLFQMSTDLTKDVTKFGKITYTLSKTQEMYNSCTLCTKGH